MLIIGLLILCSVLSLDAASVSNPFTEVENASHLFDGDEATLWLGSGALASVSFEPQGCFSQMVLVSSGDHSRDVSRIIVKYESNDNLLLAHSEDLICSEQAEQTVILGSHVCASKVVVTFKSCSSQPVALREIKTNFLQRVDNTDESKKRQHTCSTNADCAGLIANTLCDGGSCTIPECYSNADCTTADLPVCDFTAPAKPVCAALCAQNADCVHLPKYPFCGADGKCSAGDCLDNADCTSPDAPVCYKPSGICSASCTKDDECALFIGSEETDKGAWKWRCSPSTVTATAGQCVQVCKHNSDCQTRALPRCDTSLSLPACAKCTADTDCNQFVSATGFACDAGSGACVPHECDDDDDCPDYDKANCVSNKCDKCDTNLDCTHFSLHTVCSSGSCEEPECVNDYDCTDVSKSHCVSGVCQACDADQQCAHFATEVLCLGAVCQSAECYEDSDCTSPSAPVCTSNSCTSCSVDKDCAHFTFKVACVGNTCVEPECIDDRECSSPNKPVCTFPSCTTGCQPVTATCLNDGTCTDACSQFYLETFCTVDGVCKEPECYKNEDCSVAELPFCTYPEPAAGTDIPKCYSGCTTDDECSHFYVNTQCVNGQCKEPACRFNTDCRSDPTKPMCNDKKVCAAGCTDDTDCAHFFFEKRCNSVTKICENKCFEQDDCTDPSLPYCDTTAKACTAKCNSAPSDDACAQFTEEIECNPNTGVCQVPQCLVNSDCLDPEAPECQVVKGINTCGKIATCNSQSCAHFVTLPGTSADHQSADFCDSSAGPGKGVCRKLVTFDLDPNRADPECYESDDCPTTKPHCNTATHDCGPCNTNDDCAQYTDHTFCRIGECVIPECRNDADCSLLSEAFYRSSCNVDTGYCGGCLSNDDCRYIGPDHFIAPGQTALDVNGVKGSYNYPSEDDALFGFRVYCFKGGNVINGNQNPYLGGHFVPSGNVGGTCIPGCADNTECPMPGFPVCTPTTFNGDTIKVCNVGCESNADCAQFTKEYQCDSKNGVCVVPDCATNRDCTAMDKPRCAISDTTKLPTCGSCVTDDDCAHFTHAVTCDKSGSGKCITQCNDINDCKDANYPVCNVCDDSNNGSPCENPNVPHSCQPLCKSDDQCSQFWFQTKCDISTGKCIPPNAAVIDSCLEDDDCPNPAKPVCDFSDMAHPACAAKCDSHDDCTRFHQGGLILEPVMMVEPMEMTMIVKKRLDLLGIPIGFTYCYQGACIEPECTDDVDCPVDKPICVKLNSVSGDALPVCAAKCDDQDDCARFSYNTLCFEGACIIPPCVENDDCPADKPICNIVADPSIIDERLCEAKCTTHDECANFEKQIFCSDGACIEPVCQSNYDCPPAKPVCVIPDITMTPKLQPFCDAVCASHQDCVQYANEVWCHPTDKDCITPVCLENSDCPLPANAVCDLTSGPVPVCVGCTVDDECTRFALSALDTKLVCRDAKCVEPTCAETQDCPPDLPVCDLSADPPSCDAQCTSDSDCAHFASKTICVKAGHPTLTAGTCTEPLCTENDDCPAATPICSPALNPPACAIGCTSDDDCTQYAKEFVCANDICVKPACRFDSDCAGTSACDLGTRKCVDCIFDSHCTAAGAPVCNTHEHKCVRCNDKEDCPTGQSCATDKHQCVACIDDGDCGVAGSLACDPSNNLCVECTADSHCDIPDATKLACNLATRTCVECSYNHHCAGVVGSPACDFGSHTCVECVSNDDCAANPLTKTCDSVNQKCVRCLIDQDCTRAGASAALTPACHVSSRMCVACTVDAHCSGDTPACDLGTNVCVECTADDHCEHGCDVSNQVCLECSTDDDCSGDRPACDTGSGTCVVCLSSSHCTDPLAPACDVGLLECVPCTSDEHCGDATPACAVAVHTCVECTQNSHCLDDHVCDATVNRCVECLADKDCTDSEKPHCDTRAGSEKCVVCVNDNQCTDHKFPICDVSQTICVECSTSSDCWLRNATTPICTAGTCSACTKDSDCVANFLVNQACDTGTGICVPDQYKKGFYVSAVVLGSVAIFLVSGALIAIIVGAVSK